MSKSPPPSQNFLFFHVQYYIQCTGKKTNNAFCLFCISSSLLQFSSIMFVKWNLVEEKEIGAIVWKWIGVYIVHANVPSVQKKKGNGRHVYIHWFWNFHKISLEFDQINYFVPLQVIRDATLCYSLESEFCWIHFNFHFVCFLMYSNKTLQLSSLKA